MWVQGIVLLVILEGLFFGTVAIMSGWVVEDLGWWVLLVANVIAIASMGYWVTREPEAGDSGI